MIIYKAINLVNNKVYIGQGKTLLSRKSSRKSGALTGNKNSYFDNAIRKYGWDAFIFEEMDFCETQEETDYMETYWIKWFHARDKRFGYNLAEGGRVNRGYKKTKEQILKHSKTLKAKYANGEILQWTKGINRPKETRDKISKANIGKHNSPDTEFKKGQIPLNLGIPHSEETKIKISQKLKGKIAHNRRRVLCKETGIIYESVVTAQKAIKKSGFHIASVCRGERKTCGGFHWEYL